MSELYIHASMENALLFCDSPRPVGHFSFADDTGRAIAIPAPAEEQLPDGKIRYTFNASSLEPWTPDHPALYTLEADGEEQRFGMVELKTVGNSAVTINGKPCFLRGYIRGITAHDHPNLSGKSLYESFRYHIAQAKKYGFNLVRFHSTVPDPEFIRAADELGMLIHMEIGFAYRYDAKGEKQGLALDNAEWRETILRCRNHPSAAIFCIGNEMHNSGHQKLVHKLYAEGKALAPSKLIMDNSGWGEFDRTSADIYSQHIAYYFPFKRHRDMFFADACWRINGSMYDSPLETDFEKDGVTAHIRRHANPIRPALAHEAVHYIEIPDYDKLNRKFDDFAARVGKKYLEANHITKPRYLTELPALIARKGLSGRMADYRAASEKSKKFALRTYLERLRLSRLCGFEMLQFADCFKYENKNGIVDCFDDDKYIDPAWMRNFNADDVLLSDWPRECFFNGEELRFPIHLSHFSECPNPVGTLTVTLDSGDRSIEIYRGEKIAATPGVQLLTEIDLRLPPVERTTRFVVRAEFSAPEMSCRNEWEFRVFPRPEIRKGFECKLSGKELPEFLAEFSVPSPEKSEVILTDWLGEELFRDLADGKTVVLFYHRDNPGQKGFYLPGALDRFKPCIWDRGSNLGGIVEADFAREALACGRYFGAEFQGLCEGGYKLDLDHFPGPVAELISGVDKPVRDRMKGLVHHVKEFMPDDTLRNFCYLSAFKAGPGTLIVSTFSTKEIFSPGPANYFAALLNAVEKIEPGAGTDLETLEKYARTSPVIVEDVMNHFWEIDNKPVEDTLFWEETGIDLSKIE